MFTVTRIFNRVWKNQDGVQMGQSLWSKCIFLVFYCWYLVWQPAGFHIVFNRLLSAGGGATICAAWPLFLPPRRFLVSLSARRVKANERSSWGSGRIVGSRVLHLRRSQFCRTERWRVICHHDWDDLTKRIFIVGFVHQTESRRTSWHGGAGWIGCSQSVSSPSPPCSCRLDSTRLDSIQAAAAALWSRPLQTSHGPELTLKMSQLMLININR